MGSGPPDWRAIEKGNAMSMSNREDCPHDNPEQEEVEPEEDDSYYDVDPITMQEELREEARNPL